MQTKQLGTTDLHLTSIGLGTWAIGGGGWKYGWGAQDEHHRPITGTFGQSLNNQTSTREN